MVGGRLKLFVREWSAFCPDAWVVRVISEGYRLEFTTPPPRQEGVRVTPTPSDPAQRRILEAEILGLLQKGAVVKVDGSEGPLFRSTFFLVPKKGGTWRPILNLRPLNVSIRPRHFRMESLAVILPTLRCGMWATSIDLKDAYLQVPIFPGHQRFLAFQYQELTYKFTSLPFGLSTAPRVFSRVAGAVVAELRRRGIVLFAYLDDWLILADSRDQSQARTREVLEFLQSIGWVVNDDKSLLTPVQSLIYLGAQIDFTRGLVFPSKERILALVNETSVLLSTSQSTALAWLRALGMMASLVELVPLCRLRMRPLQMHLLGWFRPASRDLSCLIPLTDAVRPHLQWWRTSANLSEGVAFGRYRPPISVTTDASLSGWGGFCQDRILSGVWSSEEAHQHINVLELIAVLRSVRLLTDLARGKVLTVFSDNTTAVAYINRQGGTHSPNLCLVAWDLWMLCYRNDIHLRASHIAGKKNILADALSRGRVSQGEWELAPRWTTWLFKNVHRPLVDLFATAGNAKLPTFCSRFFHPRAWETDALSLSWDGLDAYAFPPFSLIHRILLKVRTSRVSILLIVPLWSRQPWFPLLLSLVVAPPFLFPPCSDLVAQDRGRVLHPRVQDLHLSVWRLSGIPSSHREFRKTLPIWRPSHEDHPLLELTIPELRDSISGVSERRLLRVIPL